MYEATDSKSTEMTPTRFRNRIRSWYRRNGRHELPWRKTRDPWAILVSEIMLQQTQVSRVIPKYREFLSAFPTPSALNRAPLRRALTLWQGMGYNRRVLHLKRLAEIITHEYDDRIPADLETLRRLPGIGSSTAGAIVAFAFNRRVVFAETNIRRVYLHFFFTRRRRVADARITAKIRETLPRRNIREWYWALMDYGAAAIKGVPNPNRRSKSWRRQPKFASSRRELRGKIVSAVIRGGGVGTRALASRLGRSNREIADAIAALCDEGLIAIRGNRLAVP